MVDRRNLTEIMFLYVLIPRCSVQGVLRWPHISIESMMFSQNGQPYEL